MRNSAALLLAAADALDDMQIPLCNPFLAEHEVTLDQCMSLAQQLALGARIVAHGIEHPTSEQGIALMHTLARL